jgi:hypothetical protein
MKWLRLLIVGCIIGLGASTFVQMSGANPQDCQSVYRRDTTVKVTNNYIDAEVASNDTQKELGLSNRTCIGVNQGMLFVFDKPGKYDFWMKDMKFPIDIKNLQVRLFRSTYWSYNPVTPSGSIFRKGRPYSLVCKMIQFAYG